MVLRRPSAGYQLVLALIALLMVYVVSDSLAEFWRLRLPFSELAALALAAVCYGWCWWRSPWLGSGVTVAAALAGVAAVRRSEPFRFWVARAIQEGMELFAHLRAGELETTFGPTIGVVLIALAALGAGLLITWEALGRGSAFWSTVAGVFIFGTEWAWFFDRSALYFAGYLLLALVLWTLAQAAHRDARWEASGRRIGYRSHVATPLAMVCAASIAGSVLPYDFAPINLGELGERVQAAFPVLRQLRGGGVGAGGGRFSLALTGFSPNLGTLGGPVQLDQTLALRLSVDTPLTETLYLRGATFLTYTGRTWEPGQSQPIQVPPDGTLPTNFAPDVLRDYLTVTITPALNFGRTVFNVWEPLRVDNLPSAYQADGDGNLYADRAIPRNTSYRVTARVPRYSAEQIRRLSAGHPASGRSDYLQLPDELPQRVRNLARAVASGADHTFDQAVAIESYLRSLPYDLDVPAPPPGRDFVDYFLFDLRRGYCTYYATAMVVMLRELGIPARLVEGFAVPASAAYTEDAGGTRTYQVFNAQAHAWVEAYFPGYGWATFDPTPRADLPLIARDTPAPDPTTITPADPTNETPDEPVLPPEENIPEEAGFEVGSVAAPAGREWPWFLAPLLTLPVVGLIAFRYLAAQDRLPAADSRTLVQEAWEKAAGLLARFDFGRKPHQTAREYAASLGEAFPSLRETAVQVAEDYTVARYAPPTDPVGPEAGERARSFWQQVHETLFTRYGWRTYFGRRLRWVRPKKG